MKVKVSSFHSDISRHNKKKLESIVRLATSGKKTPSSGIEKKIRKFEKVHGIKSHELRTKLRDGEIEDTANVSKWLVLLDAAGKKP